MSAKRDKTPETADDARQRLIEAALEIFSRYSYEGATTRMIAERAGVNLAAIPYYYGNKEGLYRAAIQSVADRLQSSVLPGVLEIQEIVEATDPAPGESIGHLSSLMSDFIRDILALNAPTNWFRLGFSEETEPVRAFDIIYDGFIVHIHRTVTDLVRRALDLPPESAEAVLRAHAILGQTLAFHLSREAVLKRLGRSAFTDKDVRTIQTVVRDHVHAILSSPKQGAKP